MLSCPVCGEDIAPWFIPVADGPHILGISAEEVQKLIDQRKVRLRVDLTRRRPRLLLDLLAFRPLPSRLHETMKHMDRPF